MKNIIANVLYSLGYLFSIFFSCKVQNGIKKNYAVDVYRQSSKAL